MDSSDSEDLISVDRPLSVPATIPPLISVDSIIVPVPSNSSKESARTFSDAHSEEYDIVTPWSEWDRERKRLFIERFATIARFNNNYCFNCLCCGKQLKGQFLTILVHISGIRVKSSVSSTATSQVRSIPCPLIYKSELGAQIRQEVLDLFDLEDSLAQQGIAKRRRISSSSNNGSISSVAPNYYSMSNSSNPLECLLPSGFKEEVIRWLKEDCPTTDIGGFVVGDKPETAILYLKSATVVAGVPFANAAFEYYDLDCKWNVSEGTYLDPASDSSSDSNGSKKIHCATVRGSCRNILLAERTALNILSRASGVAAAAKKVVDIKKEKNWHGFVAGTRKTTPGFKNVEKYALVVGGAATHRLDLSQMVMLKDNHIWSSGSITSAVQQARSVGGFSIKIEVECQSVEEALEAAAAGADIAMLDNFSADRIEAAAAQIKAQFPHILVEASGGITIATIADFMTPSVDVISMGSLTQGYSCADFSLKISH